MPFFVVPLVAGLVGLFAGAQVDRAVDNATTRPTTGSPGIPWQISILVVVLVAAVIFFTVKKALK